MVPTSAPSRKTRPHKTRLSLSALLALSLSLLVLLAVGAVALVALGGAGRNTRELLGDKADLILSSIEQRIRQHLDPVAEQAAYLGRLIERGAVDPADEAALAAALRAALAATPQVTGLAFVDDRSRIVGVDRATGELMRDDWSSRPEIAGVIASHRAGQRTGWAEPVYSPPFGRTIIPYSVAVRREGGFSGVVIAALTTSELSAYVARFSSPDQTAFVLRDGRQVIAHPRLVGAPPPNSRDKPLPLVGEVGDPVLAEASRRYGARDEISVPLRAGDSGVVVPMKDDYYITISRQITGYDGSPWTIGAILPGRSAGAEFDRLMRIALISAGLVALAVLAAVLLGRRLARPVRDLVEVTGRVRELDLSRVPTLPRSRIHELDVAGQSLNAMVSALRWFEHYVPRRLVQRLLAHGDGDLAKAAEREVSVMFTDICGFSRIAARLSTADTAAFLNAHFALLGACIEAEEGTIDKYIGDSVMAFWGAPDDQPDHAERACRAALAIAGAMRADNERRRGQGLEPVRIRIGISTGRVLVGNIGAPGRVNFTLVGDVVNLAQRLEELGKEVEDAGEVVALITEDSHSCLADSRQATLLGRREVRSRDGTIGIYRLSDPPP